MKLSTLTLPIGLTLFGLTACETITGVAPKDTPRVEVELAVVVDEAFLNALVDVDEESDLIRAAKDAVLSRADLGLRFYATPSENYASGDERPPYLLTVELSSLNILLDHETIEKEGAEPITQTSVSKVTANASASLEKRRENAPSLVVGRTSASAEVAAEEKPELIEAEPGYTAAHEGYTVKVLQRDIVKAVDRAVHKALKDLRTPIDREFAHEKSSSDVKGN